MSAKTGRPRGWNLRRGGPDNFMAQPGAVNPFAGRTHSPETRAILSEKASVPKPYLRGKRNGMSGRTGPANPNYKGGGSPERQRLYASSEWRAVRRRVLARDGYRCTNCGQDCKGDRTRHLHHLKSWAEYPELRFDGDNIVTLCRGCHHDAHRKEVSHQ